MASNVKISAAARNAACNAVVDLIDGGTPPGTMAFRTGAPPTNPSDESSGDLLGTLIFTNPAFGDSAVGVATAAAITSDSDADASGDIGHFRIYPGAAADTACVLQGTAGEAADTTDITFDNKTVVAGGTIAISALTVTMPEQ